MNVSTEGEVADSAGKRILPWLLALMPFAWLTYAVVKYTVEVPFWDQWDLVPYLAKLFQGTLSVSDLWAQHNEHRIFFPRLIMLVLARLTGWNTSYEVAVNVILGSAIFLALVLQLRTTAAETGASGWTWIVPVISVIIFSLAQWENWLWGWQLQMLLNVLAVVVGCVLLSRSVFSWPRFIGALLMGVVASYSFANGVAYWVIGIVALLVLLLEPESNRRETLSRLVVWLLVGGITTAAYLWGYEKPSYHPSVWTFVHQPLVFLRYQATYLFGPVAPNPLTFALTLPALVAACYCGWILARTRSVRVSALIPYLGMSLYVLASALITGIGRSGYGSGQAGQSRYLTISSLLWVSVVVLVWLYFSHSGTLTMNPRKKKFLNILAVYSIVVVVYLAALRSVFGLDFAATKQRYLTAARDELLSGKENARMDEDLLRHLYFRADTLKARLEVVQHYRLSLYRTETGR